MFSKKYIKITKEDWDKINSLFNDKDSEIKTLKTFVSVANDELKELEALRKEVETLRKYKEKDDLLYSYELSLKSAQENLLLLSYENSMLTNTIAQMEKKLDDTVMLEKLYLNKISDLSSKKCKEYQTYSVNDLDVMA